MMSMIITFQDKAVAFKIFELGLKVRLESTPGTCNTQTFCLFLFFWLLFFVLFCFVFSVLWL